MVKKLIALITAFAIIFSLTSCSGTKNAGGEGVIPPVPKDGKPELTIILSSKDYSELSSNSWLAQYIAKFKRDYGVDVKFEQIETKKDYVSQEEMDEYLKKLFVKLTTKDGPDLIFNQYMNIEPLIEQHGVADLRGKVANLDKVYDSLLGDKVYYVPLGVEYIGLLINRAVLAELGIDEPLMNWTPEDFYTVRDKWITNNRVKNNKVSFDHLQYARLFQQFIDVESLYNAEENKVTLNTPVMIQKINDLRSYIFGGNFQLIDGFKYENYYNMFYEPRSEEYKKNFEIWENRELEDELEIAQIDNLLRAGNADERIDKYAVINEPFIFYMHRKDMKNITKGVSIFSNGFLINKNAKNPDLAYEFVNGLLSNEVQLSMMDHENEYFKFYPVNKEIEADILKLEAEKNYDPRAIQVKAIALQDLKEGKCILDATEKRELSDIYKVMGMIEKDLTKLIMADKSYSDEQLQEELKRMEDKYNIYLNE